MIQAFFDAECLRHVGKHGPFAVYAPPFDLRTDERRTVLNSFVKNRLLPVFMLICMLFSFVPALAGETAYITDESRALDPLEYEYLL